MRFLNSKKMIHKIFKGEKDYLKLSHLPFNLTETLN